MWRPRRRRGPRPADLADDGPDDNLGQIPAELLQRVRAIEIKARKLVDALFLGEYRAVFRGRGIEFHELRPYVPGDDVRAIDWRTLARTGEPFIRRYAEDRDLTVIFAVDVSRSVATGAEGQSKAELAAELCAVLALAAIRNRDRVGLLLFASKPERYVRPQGGPTHVLRVVREVLSPRPATRGTGIGPALEYLTDVHRRRATVFLVSDFLTSGYAAELRAAARRHDVIAIRVRETTDAVLPDVGLARVVDAETGDQRLVDTSDAAIRDAYARHVEEIDDERRLLFGSLGIDEIALRVGEDYVPALHAFFKRRTAAA